jgi:agmatine deiminase
MFKTDAFDETDFSLDNLLFDDFLSLPAADGYRMPGEWEQHRACWMLWPSRPDVWRDRAQPAQRAFAEVAKTIARFEPVTVGVQADHFLQARQVLHESVKVTSMEYNDAWMRDVGPTFVVNDRGGLRGVDWRFNAWGEIYTDYAEDETVANQVLGMVGAERYETDFIMEGGAIHTDGEGTLLVVEENLLHVSRNPFLTKEDIEERLRAYLNVEKVIWLPYGVYEDETDGHVDNLCCFVRPGVIALTWTDDKFDPQYERSLAAYELLSQERDAHGRTFEIHKIHQPAPLYLSHQEAHGVARKAGTLQRIAGQRLAASYVNYYVANGGVIVPTFDEASDAPALAQLAQLYPNRQVIGVPAREILLGGGNIHCITQQEPMVEVGD